LKTTADVQEKLGVSRQRVHALLHEKRIDGAEWNKQLRRWIIPDDWYLVEPRQHKRADSIGKWVDKNRFTQRRAIAYWVYKTKGVELDPKKIGLEMLDQARKWIMEKGMTKEDFEVWRKK